MIRQQNCCSCFDFPHHALILPDFPPGSPKYISVIATTKIPSQESLCGICLYFRQQGTADESAEQNRRGIAGEGYLEIVHGRKDKRKMVETACGSGQKQQLCGSTVCGQQSASV